MTFTKTHPTTPGFYAWRRADDCVFAVKAYEHAGVIYSGGAAALPVSECGGEWCRLVPSEEVEEAFREGWNKRAEITGALPNMPWINNKWNNSRAKRVAEGME